MLLSELGAVLGADVPPGCGEIEVAGVSSDSRRTRPGDVFVALRGEGVDGADFAADAVRSGAVAVVCDRAVEAAGAPVLVAASAREECVWWALRAPTARRPWLTSTGP